MRTKKVGLCLSVLSFALAVPGFCGPLENTITKGNEWVQKKDYIKAVQEYERAVKIDPKNAKAHLLLGLTYANTGQLDLAIEHSMDAAILNPSYSAYHNLGLIYANKDEYEKAADAYQNALKLNAASYQAWYEFGLLQAGHGQFAEAIHCYKKAIALNPVFPDAHLGLGSANYWAGNKIAAIEEVNALQLLKYKDKAEALNNWIKDKEARKAGAGKS